MHVTIDGPHYKEFEVNGTPEECLPATLKAVERILRNGALPSNAKCFPVPNSVELRFRINRVEIQ